MTTMNISLPETLKDFVESRLSDGGYGTASEYVRELIRNDQKMAAQERLERLLLESLDSGEPIEVDADFWAKKKADLIQRTSAPAHPSNQAIKQSRRDPVRSY